MDLIALATSQALQYGATDYDYPWNNRDSPTKKGCEACFFALDDKWGFKFWRYESSRDYSYNLQHRLCDAGYAPQVCGKVNVTHPVMGLLFGFITEIAARVEIDDDEWDCEHRESFEIELIENGFHPEDLHVENVGYIDGRLVVIDCGGFGD